LGFAAAARGRRTSLCPPAWTVSWTHPSPLWMSESVALGCPPHGVEHSAYPSAGHTLTPTVPYGAPEGPLKSGLAARIGLERRVDEQGRVPVPTIASLAKLVASERKAIGSVLESRPRSDRARTARCGSSGFAAFAPSSPRTSVHAARGRRPADLTPRRRAPVSRSAHSPAQGYYPGPRSDRGAHVGTRRRA